MPLFGSKPSKGEVRGFARGRTSSAKAAEKYAQDRKRKQEFAAKKRAAQKKGR